MTVITTPPRTPDAHPAPVPGGFSGDGHPVAGAPRFRGPTPAPACGPMAPFLSPSTAEDEKLAPRASDCGEVTMRRLRHPFTVAAGTTPHIERQ
ncbi:hypothetical protein GCM10027452_07610 [Micromonospora halotolerans]